MPHNNDHGPDGPDKRRRVVLDIPNRGRFRVLANQLDQFREAYRNADTEEDIDRLVESAAISETGVTLARLRERFPEGVPLRKDLEPEEGQRLVSLTDDPEIQERNARLASVQGQAAPTESISTNNSPTILSMVGSDPYERRYIYDTPSGPQSARVNPFTAEGRLADETSEDDQLLIFLANMLSQGARLERPGTYLVTPQPTGLGRTLREFADEMPEEIGPFETRDVKSVMKGVVGLGSIFRSTFEALGVDFPESRIEEVAGPGGQAPIETAEVARQTGSPAYRDVSEPSTVVTPEEWEKLKETDPSAVSLYRMKRLLDATWRGTLLGPMIEAKVKGEDIGDQSYTSIGAQMSGEVAPPRDNTDIALDLIGTDILGPLVPSLIAWPAFTTAGAKFGATGLGRAAAGAIGTPGRLRAGATTAGAGAGGSIGYMLNQMGLVGDPDDPLTSTLVGAGIGAAAVGSPVTIATRLKGTPVSVFTRAFRMRAPQFFSTIGAEAGLGSVYGAAYGGRAAFESGHTDDIAKEAMKGAILGGTFGFGFALPFRMRAISQATRAGRVAERMAADGILSLKPGDIFNPETGLMFGGRRKNGTPFWQVKDPETGKVRFAKKEEIPDEFAIHDWVISKWINPDNDDLLNTVSTLVDKMPEMEKVKARQHTGAGDTPMDTPEKVQMANEMGHLITLREINYMPYAFKQVRAANQAGRPEVIQKKIDILKMAARSLDDTTHRHDIAELLGRARAFERVRARGIRNVSNPTGEFPEAFEGIHAFGAERAAAEIIVNTDQQMRQKIMALWELKAKLAGNDSQGIANRQVYNAMRRQLNAEKVNPEVIRSASKSASQTARRLQFKSMRGLAKGSRVMVGDNLHEVVKVSRSTWGMAQVKRGSGEPFWVDLSDVQLMPKVNRFGKLADGTPVKIVRSSSDNTSFFVERPNGTKGWARLEDIEAVGDHRIANNSHKRAFNNTKAAIRDGQVAPKEQVVDVDRKTVVDKETGEKLTVEKANNQEYVARDGLGQRKVISREDVRDVPELEGPIDDIYTFSAGTKPSEGKNIVFVTMRKPEASIFAEIMKLQGDRTALLDAVSEAHILPPPTKADEVMFALELPTTRAGLNASGRKALGVLSGKIKVDNMTRAQWENLLTLPGRTLTADDLVDARVYEVPETLQQHVQTPEASFDWSPEDKSTYVSKLTDLSFEVSKEAGRAKKRGNRAAELLETARKRNRGDEATQAERQIEHARADIVKAHIRKNEQVVDGAREIQTERIRSTSTIRDTQESSLLRDGNLEAVRKTINEYPIGDGKWDNRPLVFESADIPGARLVVHKIGAEDASMTARRLVDPEAHGPGTKYLIEEVAEDGTVVHSKVISNTSEFTPTEVPAVSVEGIKPKVGDVYLAVGKDEIATVYVNEIADKLPGEIAGGRAPVEARIPDADFELLQQAINARTELESGRVIYPGLKKVKGKDPETGDIVESLTHYTEAEMIALLESRIGKKFSTTQIHKMLQGKGLGASEAKVRQRVDAAGKARLDELQNEINQLRALENQTPDIKAEIEEIQAEIQQLPQQFPGGTRRVQLIDSQTGEGFAISPGQQETIAPFFGLMSGDVMPGMVYNSRGKQMKLYRSVDPADRIERINAPRTPDELAKLTAKAQQLEAQGAAVAIPDIPYKTVLNDDQVLDRVMERVGTFDTRANTNLNGSEWRSALGGLYATSYRTRQGWRVDFWNTAKNRRDPLANPVRVALGGPDVSVDKSLNVTSSLDNRTGEFVHKRTFNTRQEAESFLRDEGFRKPEGAGARRQTPPKLAAIIDELHNRIGELAEALPANRSVAQALGKYNIKQRTHTGGVSASELNIEGMTTQQIGRLKGKITRTRNQLVDALREEGYDEELIRGAIIGSRQSAKDIISQPGEGGVADQLAELPHWESIGKNELDGIERALEKAWMFYSQRNNGYVPPELRNYAFRFAMRRFELLGSDRNPPFFAQMRDNIGYIAEPDIIRHARFDKGVDAYSAARGADPVAPKASGTGTVVTDLDSAAAADAFTLVPGRRILADDQLGITSEFIEHLQAVKKFHDDIVDRGPVFKHIDDVLDPTDPNTPIEDISIARLKLDGQEELVQITSYDFENASVTVMTPEGTFHEVALSDISLIRSAQAKFDYVRMSKVANDEPYFITTSKDVGYHDLDKGLGIRPGAEELDLGRAIARRVRRLIGTDDPAIRERSPDIPRTREAPIRFTKKGTLYKNTSPEQMNELINLHVRSVEIGRPGEVINRIPEKARAAFRKNVYDWVVEQRGDSPLTYLEALLKSGQMKTKQLKRLADHAAANGIETDNPLRQLEELIKLNKMDPAIGKLMVNMNKEAGLIRSWQALSDAAGPEFSPSQVDISKVTRYNDIHKWSIITASPDYVASRSPSVEIFNNLVWDAQIQENQMFENMVLRQNAEIMDHYGIGGMNEVKLGIQQILRRVDKSELKPYRQIKEARDLLNQYRTWDEVLENVSDVDPGVKFAFDRFRTMTEELRLQVIQSAMRQGRTWVRFGDLGDDQQAVMARSFGQTIDDIDPDAMVVDHYKHRSARRSKTEAAEFTELLDQFESLKDIPKAVREQLPGWMLEEFDYWKGFGIENYWPQIHRGKIIVQAINADGTPTTIAWARNGAEVNDSIRRAIKEGRIKPETTIRAEPVGYTMDDVLMNIIDSKQYDKIIRGLMDAARIEPAQASEILSGANIRPVSGRTTLQNLQLRKQNLASLIDNPLEEMMIYGARVTRNQYLLDVDDAFTWVKNNDQLLSQAFDQASLDDMPNMTEWLNDAWATAKGESGWMERQFDTMLMAFDFLGSLPKQIIDDLRDQGPGVLANPEIRSRWRNTKFHEAPYRSKNFSNDIASIHGVLKLGFTPSSAAVNLSQLLINTYPVLGRKYFFEGINNYARLRVGGQIDDALRNDLVDVLDQVGVKWQRSLASAQTGLGTPGGQAPGIRTILKDMHHPRTAQNTSMGGVADMIEEFGMFAFEGAEQVNRSSTAIGAYLKALAPEAEGGLGLSRDAAIQFAKKTVNDTQFQYFDSALPKMLRGPVAKVAMQFKPYLYNQLRFEKNLIQAAMRGDAGAASTLAKHFGAIMALGGYRGVAKHPFVAPLLTLWGLSQGDGIKLFEEPATMAEKFHDAENAPAGSKPLHWVAKDVFNHGLPGLLGISVASRVGVAGTDLQFWNDPWSFYGGPQGSLVAQLFAHQRMVWGQEGGQQQVLGNLGAASLAKSLFSAAGRRAPPLSLISTALLANEIQSHFSSTPGRGLLEDPTTQLAPSTEGERLVRNLLPKFVSDVERAGLIWNEALYYDTSGKPIPVPLSGLDHVSATMAAFTGFQSVDDADRLAAEQMLRSRDKKAQATRRAFLESMARAAINEDWNRLYELKAQAAEMDITITEEQLRTQKRQLEETRINQFNRGLMNEGLVEYEPLEKE